jgi:hypothetical protein
VVEGSLFFDEEPLDGLESGVGFQFFLFFEEFGDSLDVFLDDRIE